MTMQGQGQAEVLQSSGPPKSCCVKDGVKEKAFVPNVSLISDCPSSLLGLWGTLGEEVFQLGGSCC